ncbi:ABC1 kinase family protein [Psychrobacter sanguinis]|uniref:ABC1 kinase family protein n=1 Tax=Psychrobacter sanguinis TaxID=861445 RepID=UPI00020C75EC|nr:AarF/UbiB family protein [Psychrobacter sanguinis]EGK14947.1 2-polyprenylphenol 6-hydroxylase [Psychrobacter sp. 1501(2011)]MCC3308210.1 2-octaprenylphenol hydroxylase [Psychrobacter sanguinis]MCD9151049.1 AarF/UbiB family protein [Psychrobacter sanguinis]MDY3305766.1 AarF/UbiB family protein [Psychrobacter sanguinis]UEC25482.1 2-octaprenylphenol hydroxylase [Psychrobacter sanguinis]
MLLSHRKRLLELWRIAAHYRLDTHLPVEDAPQLQSVARMIKSHPAAWGKQHQDNGVKFALEEMGTLFLKLGQLLSTRRDLVTPAIIDQLVQLQDRVKPFDVNIAIAQIEDPKFGLGKSINTLFARFDTKPLAAASIAQVHTAALYDGREVVVKVVRPDIRERIVSDFELLRDMAQWASARLEAARAVRIIDVVEDYRQIMLNELDLTFEADNTTKMRNNFLGSSMMYVPEVYADSKNVMVMERIVGVPISQTHVFDELQYDRAALAEKGLTIFFTQVFRDNFFHADMHPGNVFVETLPADTPEPYRFYPRYIGLDCAIMGELSKDDQMIVARMLLAVMNNNFTNLVDIVSRAGWIPPNTDKHALTRDMRRTVAPMVLKPINEIDFAGVLMQILDIARRHHMSIPPQLMLLLKTLVHVEGLGRDLYPELDIWSLAKPILTGWVKEQLDPVRNMRELREQLPELLLSTAQVPKLLDQGLQSMASQGARQDQQLREIQQIRADMLNDRRKDWIALAGFVISVAIATQVIGWLSPLFYILAILFVIWRILG